MERIERIITMTEEEFRILGKMVDFALNNSRFNKTWKQKVRNREVFKNNILEADRVVFRSGEWNPEYESNDPYTCEITQKSGRVINVKIPLWMISHFSWLSDDHYYWSD